MYRCSPCVVLLILSACGWQEAEPTSEKRASEMLIDSEKGTQKKTEDEVRSKAYIQFVACA